MMPLASGLFVMLAAIQITIANAVGFSVSLQEVGVFFRRDLLTGFATGVRGSEP